MAAWSPHAEGYQLATAGLKARLRLEPPPPGLTADEVPGWQHSQGMPECQLAIDALAYRCDGEIRAQRVGSPGCIREHVQKQQTVVLTYPQDPDCPVRLTARWRAGCVDVRGGNDEVDRRPLVDLQLEAQTDGEFGAFECITRTAFASERLWFLLGSDTSPKWVELGPWMPHGVHRVVFPRDERTAALTYDGRFPESRSTLTGPVGVMPLVVWRLPGGQVTYVEMCHVHDGARLIVQRPPAAAGMLVQSGYALFAQDLEKGVVLRARLRGVWLSREGDLKSAHMLFQRFLREPPPLAS